MWAVRHFKESFVSFRIFLLSLCLFVPALHAQEVAPAATPEESATTAPTAAVVPEKRPLSAEDISSIHMPDNAAERDEMADRSVLLTTESEQRKERAELELEAAKTACWKKFLVSACLDDARVVYRKEISLAKRQEREAKTLERNVRKYDAAEKNRQREEETARRDADYEKKAEEYRAKQAGKKKPTQP
jgi:hypothetical protein